MTRQNRDVLGGVQRDLQAWRATHPQATFAEIEGAVEERIRQIRAQLLEETVATGFQEVHPACPHCGTTMRPRTRLMRTVVVPGEEAVGVEGAYVVCPACETALFPPR